VSFSLQSAAFFLGKYGADASFPYENVILCCKTVSYMSAYESGALPLSYCGKFEFCRIPTCVAEYGAGPSNDLTARMPWSGLEPLCLTAPPPQDGVSTNFTTRATSLHARQLAANRFPLPASRFPTKNTGPTGLEPATTRVTVECSNQAELRPQLLESGSETPSSLRTFLVTEPVVNQPAE
jgi:hypothetical protein